MPMEGHENLKKSNVQEFLRFHRSTKIRLVFFYSAYQGTPRKCETSSILYLIEKRYVSFKYATDQRTNNRAEFYTLWLLLKCAT